MGITYLKGSTAPGQEQMMNTGTNINLPSLGTALKYKSSNLLLAPIKEEENLREQNYYLNSSSPSNDRNKAINSLLNSNTPDLSNIDQSSLLLPFTKYQPIEPTNLKYQPIGSPKDFMTFNCSQTITNENRWDVEVKETVLKNLDAKITDIIGYEVPSGRMISCSFKGCTKKFTCNSRLQRHMVVHTGDKPFVCPDSECSKRFSRKDNMMQHYRIHLISQKKKRNQKNE